MTVTLRNAVTGADVQTTTTSRGGQYRFGGLIQGEYMLTATGPRGSGVVDGIFVAAEHEEHIQIAIELQPLRAESPPPTGKILAASLTPPPPQPPPVAFPHPVYPPAPTLSLSVSESSAPQPTLPVSVTPVAKILPAEAASDPTLARAVLAVKLGSERRLHTRSSNRSHRTNGCASNCDHPRTFAIIGFNAVTGPPAVWPQLAKLRSRFSRRGRSSRRRSRAFCGRGDRITAHS